MQCSDPATPAGTAAAVSPGSSSGGRREEQAGRGADPRAILAAEGAAERQVHTPPAWGQPGCGRLCSPAGGRVAPVDSASYTRRPGSGRCIPQSLGSAGPRKAQGLGQSQPRHPARLSWEGSACPSKAWVGPARSRSRAWVGSAYASSRAEQVQPAPHTLTLQSLLKGTVPGTGPASLGFPSESLPGCTCFSTQGLSLWFSSSLWLDLGQHGPTSDLQNRKPSLYPWCWWADG